MAARRAPQLVFYSRDGAAARPRAPPSDDAPIAFAALLRYAPLLSLALGAALADEPALAANVLVAAVRGGSSGASSSSSSGGGGDVLRLLPPHARRRFQTELEAVSGGDPGPDALDAG